MTDFTPRKTYSFDTQLAKECGVEAAILYNDIVHWISFNAQHEYVHKEGKVWSFSTYKQIADRIEFLTERQVKYAMEKLIDKGLIIKGNFNPNVFDKTSWFTISDPSLQLKSNKVHERQICPIEETNLSDPTDKFVRSINRNKTSKRKEEQQQKKEPKGVVVLSCLDQLKLSEDEKRDICKKYTPDEIELGVERTLKSASRESDLKFLLWILRTPQAWKEPAAPDNSAEEKNKALTLKVEKALIEKMGYSFIDVWAEYVVLDKNPYNLTSLYYKDKGFRERMDSALRKQNLSLKELNL